MFAEYFSLKNMILLILYLLETTWLEYFNLNLPEI